MAEPNSPSPSHTRRISAAQENYHPRYVVWELTLACDQLCTHCGSRAGSARGVELSTDECLKIVDQLAEMGTRDVILIGGEAYLHSGFLQIIRALRAKGIKPSMTTGGLGVTPQLAKDMLEAGIEHVSVSVDGLEDTHDLIRAHKGSFRSAINALDILKAEGVLSAANTNVNRINQKDLEALYELLAEKGIVSWQVQITVPLGRAADRPNMLLQPYDLMEIFPRLATLKQQALQEGIIVMPGNNLGYFGPEEALMRSLYEGGADHWVGCPAGKFVMGIESDGAVKGCPSLQTDAYVGGHLSERTLEDIWTEAPELSFTRNRTVDDLWGFCKTCPFAETCMAGCSFTAHALFGKPGNNPYCHFRARTLAKQGKRERLVLRTNAQGLPFDHGLYEIILEDLDAPEFTQVDGLDERKRLIRMIQKVVA